MNRKILILAEDPRDIPGDIPALCQVHSCSDPSEALSMIMGASTGYGNDNYFQTGKIRPEIVLIDESYLKTNKGVEFLDILRKYYSLKLVKLFIVGSPEMSLDLGLFSKYNVTGYLARPYSFTTITQMFNTQPSSKNTSSTRGSMMSLGFFTGWYKKISTQFSGFHAGLLTGKTLAITTVSVLTTTAAIVSGTYLFREQTLKPVAAPLRPLSSTEIIKNTIIEPQPESELQESPPLQEPVVTTKPTHIIERAVSPQEQLTAEPPTESAASAPVDPTAKAEYKIGVEALDEE
jgi:hypothetical protein